MGSGLIHHPLISAILTDLSTDKQPGEKSAQLSHCETVAEVVKEHETKKKKTRYRYVEDQIFSSISTEKRIRLEDLNMLNTSS